MRLIFGAVLIAGLGLAGFAVFQTNQYIAQMQAQLYAAQQNVPTTVEMADVLVTRRQLLYGQEMTRADVQAIQFPSHAVPQGAYTSMDALFPNNIPSRVVLRAMDPSELILGSKLTAPGQVAGITSHLSPGKRAFTIPVNQTSGVAGFLRPGDHVDVFWTGRPQGQGEVTQLIQPRIRLIAVDQSADMDRTTNAISASTVTVEATSEQAAALALAQSSGRLSLALVGMDDQLPDSMVEMTQDRMLGIVREERPEVQEARQCHVRTRRGNEMVLIEIPCTN